MKSVGKLLLQILCCISAVCSCACAGEQSDQHDSVTWIRPTTQGAEPIWGLKGAISIGLWPTAGPRGLIRIFTPYLDQPPGRIEQFIAIEPVVGGKRDLSELQTSRSDGKPGKRMWTANEVDLSHPPEASSKLATGLITDETGHQALSFCIIVDPFDNGACPIVKITLRSDRPHEILLQTFAAAGSLPMESCVLTATMGNYSRLRHVQLKDSVVDAGQLFTHSILDHSQFFPWQSWDASDLPEDHGQVIFSATGDNDASTPRNVPKSWQYVGLPARQYWKCKVCPGLKARVNGRETFWKTSVKIPGGAAFENFELMAPFSNGQQFCFGIDP